MPGREALYISREHPSLKPEHGLWEQEQYSSEHEETGASLESQHRYQG